MPTRFDVDGLRGGIKFFRSFRNVYNFFSLYANAETEDAFTEKKFPMRTAEIDRWILSRYHHLIGMYHEEMDRFELTKVVRAINDFVIEICPTGISAETAAASGKTAWTMTKKPCTKPRVKS